MPYIYNAANEAFGLSCVIGFRPIVSLWDLDLLVKCLRGRFLSDPSPYFREFRRKVRKIPNAEVEKRDRILNLEPLVYQL